MMTLLLLAALQDPAALVEQMGSETIQAREAAEARLRALGPDLLPLLRRTARRHPSAEVRLRADRVVRHHTEIRWSPALKTALHEAMLRDRPLFVLSTIGPRDGYL